MLCRRASRSKIAAGRAGSAPFEDTLSPRTTFLSRMIGLYCVLIALSMVTHKQATERTMNALINNPPLLFIVALLAMAAGIAIVLTHNVWSGGALPIIITLVGWLSLFKGLTFLFLPPDAAVNYFAALHYEQLFYLYAAIDLILGAYLTYSGFRSH
jgi:hypothetical protein